MHALVLFIYIYIYKHHSSLLIRKFQHAKDFGLGVMNALPFIKQPDRVARKAD